MTVVLYLYCRFYRFGRILIRLNSCNRKLL
nr:MAG TPA: hypothetical protein [Caudoviricetes sp.]